MPGWSAVPPISPNIASGPEQASMRLASLALHAYQLPLRRAWRSAAGGMTQRSGWLLRLKNGEGRCGYGDCAPLPAIGTESPSSALAALQAWKAWLPGMSAADALARLTALPLDAPAPAARCALETALLDLLAQEAGIPLARYLGAGNTATTAVPVNAALGALADIAPGDVAQALEAGHGVLKLKVGLGPPALELQQLRQLAEVLPPGITLRLDANRAWEMEYACTMIDGLASLPVESLEEPLQRPNWPEWRALQARCTFPLAVDESLAQFPADSWQEAGLRRLILKPPRLGGLLASRELAQAFIATGGDCVVTSSLESSCGILAATHLALAINSRHPTNQTGYQGGNPAHGLATATWLEANLGPPTLPRQGRIPCPALPGLGFTPFPSVKFAENGG